MFRRFLIVLISVIASIPFLTSSYSVGTITLEEFQDARNGFLFYPKLLAELCTSALQLYVRLSCHKHYRQLTEMNYENVLDDIFKTAIIIGGRGSFDKETFLKLENGIRRIKSHIHHFTTFHAPKGIKIQTTPNFLYD